jgi:hypothetical protein
MYGREVGLPRKVDMGRMIGMFVIVELVRIV